MVDVVGAAEPQVSGVEELGHGVPVVAGDGLRAAGAGRVGPQDMSGALDEEQPRVVGEADDAGDLARVLCRRRAMVGGLDGDGVAEQRVLHGAGLTGHADHHQVARASQDHSRAS